MTTALSLGEQISVYYPLAVTATENGVVMSTTIDRRTFLRGGLAASGLAMFGGTLLRSTLARAATVTGVGPYGPLSATADANGFFLPNGFTSRLLATSGTKVAGTNFTWPYAPDGGACFPVPSGGWVYVVNSEVSSGGGGASSLRFDASGQIVDAYSILTGTSRNCAGGKTVAGKWFSCEEDGSAGKVYECDPLTAGQGVMRPALGSFNHEAAVEDPATGYVYLTEDSTSGRLYRFVPTTRGDFSAGQLFAAARSNGVLSWIPTSASVPDRQSTTSIFNGGEGLWIENRTMYVTTKGDKRVWEVNLDTQAISVLYDGVAMSTAALNAVDNCTVHSPSGDVYVCEDGGNMEVCVIAANGAGDREVAAFLRITGHSSSEWCGVAFSPDHTRMYVSSQRGIDGATGRTYEITGPFRTSVTPPTTWETLIASASTWKYHDQGANLGTTWSDYYFNDSTWAQGAAPLGYGDTVATTVSFGPSSTSKYITTYFRRTFTASHGYSALQISLRRDDGAVIYLNGAEVARSNMPTGTVTSSTLASTAIAGADETTYFSIPITGQLYNGANVLAVELHQSGASSSDIVFDLALRGTGDTGALPNPPAPPPPSTTTLVVTDDATVRGGTYASRNYGTATSGQVQNSSASNTRWHYLQLDTSSHVGSVSRAVLRLSMTGAKSATTPLAVKAVSNAWNESTITWNNKPAVGAIVASGSVTGNRAKWYEFDVTEYVKAQRLSGVTRVSVAIQATQATSSLVQLSSGEATASLRPQLVITA